MSTPQTEANKDGAASGLALATGSEVSRRPYDAERSVICGDDGKWRRATEKEWLETNSAAVPMGYIYRSPSSDGSDLIPIFQNQ